MLTFALVLLLAQSAEPIGNDPFWVLPHQPGLAAELKLSAVQKKKLEDLLAGLDVRYFPLRNKSAADAHAGFAKLTAETKDGLKSILQPKQQKRFREIRLRSMGHRALFDPELAAKLRLTEDQQSEARAIDESARTALAAIQKETDATKQKTREKRTQDLHADAQRKLLDLLTAEQKTTLKKELGAEIQLWKLGQIRYKAPEFVDTGEWINGDPVRLADLRGKVVVVHFYAFGCINCIRNYPHYRKWQDHFKDKDVLLVGIHTPETSSERDKANVRKKAADEKFAFPILIDEDQKNWNAWGNSMWPCVYIIDKRGYLREFWMGELNWQGREGEKYMREKIEELLAEPETSKH